MLKYSEFIELPRLPGLVIRDHQARTAVRVNLGKGVAVHAKLMSSATMAFLATTPGK